MAKRRASRLAFVYGVVTALAVTAIILYSLVAGWSWRQSLILTIGVLAILWALMFSLLEVKRISSRSRSILGPKEAVDPDASRRVTVGPPTGEALPHHEFHPGSPGMDQGQLTANLPDAVPFVGEVERRHQKEHV